MKNMLMENVKQQVMAEFEQYRALKTDAERDNFWQGISERSEKLPVDQRLEFQQAVREQTDQILQRMTTIAQQLTSGERVPSA